MRIDEQLANIVVVLKDTTHPGNIGAVARAMKTMSLSVLRLAAAKTFIDEQSQAMAANAGDILDNAVRYPTLAASIADVTCVFAFTARRRDLTPKFCAPRTAAAEAVQRVRAGGKVAYVFGGERSGLENEDIQQANFVVEIPANPTHASLNLAQAVQIAAYELRLAAIAEATTAAATTDGVAAATAADKREMPSKEEFEAMMTHLQTALQSMGLPKKNDRRPLLPKLRNLLSRAEPDSGEVRLLRGIFKKIIGNDTRED